MTLRESDYLFEWLDRATGSTRKLEPGTSPFYLLFQYRGRENIGAITDRELALELARKHARETPGVQYIVMRAEVVVRAEPTRCGQADRAIGVSNMIQRDYEKIVAIVCDFCLDDFRPEFEDGDDATEISIAWAQAEACGWAARWDAEADSWLHCCLACARQVAA